MLEKVSLTIRKKNMDTLTFQSGEIATFQFMPAEGVLFIRTVEKKTRTKKRITVEFDRYWIQIKDIENMYMSTHVEANGKDEVEYYEEFEKEGIDLFSSNIEDYILKPNLSFPTQEEIEQARKEFEQRVKNKKKVHES